MVFLGLVLVVAAIGVGVGVAMENAGTADLTVYGESIPGITSQWQVFFAGAGLAVVFMLGLMVTFAGMGRMMRARRDLRYLREEHEESLTTLEMEKRQLQRELARFRQGGGAAPRPAQSRQAAAPAPAPTPAAAPTRSGPRSQISAASTFFDRAD